MKAARLVVVCAATALAVLASSGIALSQDTVDVPRVNVPPVKLYWGLSGIALGTRESPAVNDRTLTEGYLSQPMFMGSAALPHGFDFNATLNFEGLTLKRGELNAGMSGEGYIDRRHPHTYLHELVATWKRDLGTNSVISATAGKGFAPFGTDDPMMRPFVKYPVNHHLAQIPERAIVIWARRRTVRSASSSPGSMEDEPESPSDWPNSSRLFDSWSGRATARIRDASEFQVSFASVVSPEIAVGGGLDQKKLSASGRYQSKMLYGLAEYAYSQELESGREAFDFNSMLAEGSVTRSRFLVSVRIERTERAEEERQANPFRTPRPETDLSILGRTRWTIGTVGTSRSFTVRKSILAPFIEVGRAHVAGLDKFAVFDPQSFYGSNVIWSFSAGVRFGLGMMMNRMGRYGAALPKASMDMGDMEGMDMSQ